MFTNTYLPTTDIITNLNEKRKFVYSHTEICKRNCDLNKIGNLVLAEANKLNCEKIEIEIPGNIHEENVHMYIEMLRKTDPQWNLKFEERTTTEIEIECCSFHTDGEGICTCQSVETTYNVLSLSVVT